ncbi:hypothetical protein [Vibrio sp. WXL103]|uniref:hypothetical protein n=1 Tax=unclassified Vibrio TaxID=2614977 RepID=UPI003EC8A721
MKLRKTTLIALPMFLIGCAHFDDVRPGIDGQHYVTVSAKSQTDATREALAQTRHYCEQFSKAPAIVEETNRFEASISQEQYESRKQIAKAAQAGGTALWVFSDDKTAEKAGATTSALGAAYHSSMEDAYIAHIVFECR